MSLARVLDEVGMQPHLWSSPDGSRALLLPHGGRILALCSPHSEENFLWTHPALQNSETAQAFYAGEWWHNSGGDRTWLAPEYSLFYPNYPNPEPYFQPRQLDPGNYQLDVAAGAVTLINHLSLGMYASGQTVCAAIRKTITPAMNPLLRLSGWSGADLEFAGYTLSTTLTLQNEADSAPLLGLWSLLQLPHGGEMVFATHSRPAVVHYMGSIASSDLVLSEHAVRYRMHASGEHKIGIAPVFLTGRAAYLYGDTQRSSLIVRNFVVSPSGQYVDVPFNEPRAAGSAAQACNVKSHLGSFSELEYHTPAIGGSSGKSECSDESQLWAFRGPQPLVLEAARLLVSPELQLT